MWDADTKASAKTDCSTASEGYTSYALDRRGTGGRAASQSCRVRGLPAGQELWENSMRVFFGIILGFLLTVGGVYVADKVSPPPVGEKPMVNWDVVSKHIDGLVAL